MSGSGTVFVTGNVQSIASGISTARSGIVFSHRRCPSRCCSHLWRYLASDRLVVRVGWKGSGRECGRGQGSAGSHAMVRRRAIHTAVSIRSCRRALCAVLMAAL